MVEHIPRFTTVEVGDLLAECTRNLSPMSYYIAIGFGERVPPLVTHPSEDIRILLGRPAPGQSRPLKRSFAMLGMLLIVMAIT
jgi:hypothetical protein